MNRAKITQRRRTKTRTPKKRLGKTTPNLNQKRRVRKTIRKRGYAKRVRGGDGGDDEFTFQSMRDYTDRIMDDESFSFLQRVQGAIGLFIEPLAHNNGYGGEIGIVLDRDATNGIYSLSVLCSRNHNEVTCYFDEVKMNIESIEKCGGIMSGTALMNALLGFADHIGISTIYLTDVATIILSEREEITFQPQVDLGLYSILLNGKTWYEKFRFQPINENVSNEHAKRDALRHTNITELVRRGYAGEYEFNELINYLTNIKSTYDWSKHDVKNTVWILTSLIKLYNAKPELNDTEIQMVTNAVKSINTIISIAESKTIDIKIYFMVRYK